MGTLKRCAVYTITDGNGKSIDAYKEKALKALKEVSDFLLVVCKADVSKEEEETLKKYSNFLFKTKRGVCVEDAYVKALYYLKSAPAFDFDEIILMDDSVFGPIYSLDLYFEKMEDRPCDFWSLTKKKNGFPDAYFLVLRSTIVKDPALSKELENCLKEKNSFEVFIQNLGLKYIHLPAIDMDDLLTFSENPLMEDPYYLVNHKKCPFIKVDIFYKDYQETFKETDGSQLRKAFFYIKEQTTYNTDLIWQRILQVGNMADIKKQMQLNYVLSSSLPSVKKVVSEKQLKIALILHIYYDDLAGYCRTYAESMPQGTDVFITVPNNEKLESVKKAFVDFPYNIEYRVTGNIGRDVGPFIVGCKDIIDQYDLICKMHDKRVYQVKPMSIGESWSHKCFENLLKNKLFVENIIKLFEEESYLGMLMPPIPMHGPYYPTIGFGEWGFNYGKVLEVYNLLGLQVPISNDKEPIAPLGSMFWFRTEALKPIFDYDWTYEALPKEPISDDQTILHAIERVYPFCAQEAGYYSAWIMADSYAKIEIDNLNHMNRELQKKEFNLVGAETFENLLSKTKRA